MADALAKIGIFAAFMGLVIGITFLGEKIHEDDKKLPAYRQRIRVGRVGWRRSWAPRWHVWAAYSILPLAILFFSVRW